MIPDYRPLFYWITERESARIIKDSGGEFPYIDDPIISKFRFCNVRREDDRGTVWIRQNIREPFADEPYLWFMLCVARQINWPDTLAELIAGGIGPFATWPNDRKFRPANMADALNARKARGDKVYTGAYMISAPSTKGADKQRYIAQTVLGALWDVRDEITDYLESGTATLQGMHTRLTKYNGWGPFMAYQAVVDMRFTPLLDKASDIATWAAAGPGTVRGLNRVYGRDLKFPLKQDQALREMRLIYEVVEKETGVPLDFSDVPNCLCETDKFLRVENNEGKPRALYVRGRGH